MQAVKYILSILIGYMLGTIPVGMLIGKAYGNMDIRKTGSGNSGTTNVLRTLGWLPSVLTLIGDCLKGIVSALIGRALGGEIGMLLAAFFAVVGHDFPFYLHFKGGKGIATSWGVSWMVAPRVAPWLLVIVIVVVAVTKTMSLGTLIASIAYPILFYFLRPAGSNPTAYLIFSIALMLLSFFCHRANILRLIRGEENRLEFKKIGKLSTKYMKFNVDRIKRHTKKKDSQDDQNDDDKKD